VAEIARILIIVKTYPVPSMRYRELVCTAGVREDGSFIRLYPIDYRYRPYAEWYQKYQWIELNVERNEKDPRPESYRPFPGTEIKCIGQPLPTTDHWAERKRCVLAQGTQILCHLQELPQQSRSLGIIRPRTVKDLIAEPVESEWTPKQNEMFKQLDLFGPNRGPLEKIPYRFVYVFQCEHPRCKGHRMMIEDWEVGELFRKMRDQHDDRTAVQKVIDRFLGTICAENIDTHFFVGTVLEHNTWIVLGTFWPTKPQQQRLFW